MIDRSVKMAQIPKFLLFYQQYIYKSKMDGRAGVYDNLLHVTSFANYSVSFFMTFRLKYLIIDFQYGVYWNDLVMRTSFQVHCKIKGQRSDSIEWHTPSYVEKILLKTKLHITKSALLYTEQEKYNFGGC